jgi:hypothetical protein
VWFRTPAYAVPAVAASTIPPMNIFVSRVLGFMIFSFR